MRYSGSCLGRKILLAVLERLQPALNGRGWCALPGRGGTILEPLCAFSGHTGADCRRGEVGVDEKQVAPAVKAWVDSVLVPAMVKQWMAAEPEGQRQCETAKLR